MITNRLILLILSFPLLVKSIQFHIFFAVQCEPFCELQIRHQSNESFSFTHYPSKFARHFEEPIPEVELIFRIALNGTDLLTQEIRLKWISHVEKTFYFKQNGIFLIAHYFCPEGKCQFDTTRADFRSNVNRGSCVLMTSGIIFFLLMSGAIDVFYRRLKQCWIGKVPEFFEMPDTIPVING